MRSSLFIFVAAVSATPAFSPSSAWPQIVNRLWVKRASLTFKCAQDFNKVKSLCTSFLGYKTFTAPAQTTTVTSTSSQTIYTPSTVVNVVPSTVTQYSTTTLVETLSSAVTETDVSTNLVTSTQETTSFTTVATVTANFKRAKKADPVVTVFNQIASVDPKFLRQVCLLLVKQPSTTTTLPPSTAVQSAVVQITQPSLTTVDSTSVKMDTQQIVETSQTVQLSTVTSFSTEINTTVQTRVITSTVTATAPGCKTTRGICYQKNQYDKVCQLRVNAGSEVPSPVYTNSSIDMCLAQCEALGNNCVLAEYSSSAKTCSIYRQSHGVSRADGYAYVFNQQYPC